MPVYNGLNQLYFLETNNLKFMVYCKPEITGWCISKQYFSRLDQPCTDLILKPEEEWSGNTKYSYYHSAPEFEIT